METLTPAQYDSYLTCDTPGVAAWLPAPDVTGWAVVYTDFNTAGGVAPADGQDDDWAVALAQYWREQARRGVNPGVVFDRLVAGSGARAVEYTHLRDLAADLATRPGRRKGCRH